MCGGFERVSAVNLCDADLCGAVRKVEVTDIYASSSPDTQVRPSANVPRRLSSLHKFSYGPDGDNIRFRLNKVFGSDETF